MGAPAPWPTRWPEPFYPRIPYYPSIIDPERPQKPIKEPDFLPGEEPLDEPVRLPEDYDPDAPNAVTWGVTHLCNLHCRHCYDFVNYKRKDLCTAEAKMIIDRLADVGTRYLVFSGGEPLLRGDVYELMRHCIKRQIRIGMRSNATLITASVARQLADSGVEVVGASLDGAMQSTHEGIRGSGVFQAALAGVKSLVSAGIRVNIEVVLSRRNAQESLRFVELAESLGAQEVNFSALAPHGRAIHLSEDCLDHKTWRELTATLYHASLEATVDVSPSCALVGKCVSCIRPNVTCDGWVTPCYLSNHKLFNILDTPPEEVLVRLKLARPYNLDVCGRKAWVYRAAELWDLLPNTVTGYTLNVLPVALQVNCLKCLR